MASGAEIYTLVADFRHFVLSFFRGKAYICSFCSFFCPKSPVPVKIILSDFLFLHTLHAINTGTFFTKNLNSRSKKHNILFILSGQTEKSGTKKGATLPAQLLFCVASVLAEYNTQSLTVF